MSANELRIGNWVMAFDEFGHLSPTKLDFSLLGDIIDDLATVNPIPLTPEILEKAGFEHVNDTWDLRIDSGLLAIDDQDYSFAIFNDHTEVGFASNCVAAITSVHRLQNLIFALTGEELEINL